MIKVRDFNNIVVDEVKFTGNLGSYLDSIDEKWRSTTNLSLTVCVNGVELSPVFFDETEISENDCVDIYMIPKGNVLHTFGRALTLGGDFFSGWLFRSFGKGQQNPALDTKNQSRQIESVDIKGNQARLGQSVPEGIGRYRRYPDLLSQPRRRFISPREQVVTSIMCQGVGSYVNEDYKIGDTPATDFAGTSITQFNPGEVIPSEFSELWHTVEEVGGTSNGSAGLDMSGEPTGIDPNPPDYSNAQPAGGYHFNGLQITRVDGSNWNNLWDDSVEININYIAECLIPNQVLFEIHGNFSMLGYSVGDTVKEFRNKTVLIFTGSWVYVEFEPQLYSNDIIRYRSKPPYNLNLTLDQSGDMAGDIDVSFQLRWNVSSVDDDILILESKGSSTFQDVISERSTIQYISGGIDAGQSSGMPYTNLYQATPEGISTDLIELDFLFPSGLIWAYRDQASGLPIDFFYSVTVDVQVVDANSNDIIAFETRTFTNNTIDGIGYTFQIRLDEEVEPLVRVRRRLAENILSEVSDKITWYGLKSLVGYQDQYPNWTTLGVSIQSGGKVAMSSENRVNVVQTRILPDLNSDGSWSDPVATRSIPSSVKYITNLIGYNDDEIDLDEILFLNENYWKPRNEFIDYIFDDMTVKQVLDIILGAGMSSLTISNSKIKPVRNDVREKVEQSYSAQNAIGISQHFKSSEDHDFDGIELEYTDESSYLTKTLICKLPDSQGLKLRKVTLKGVINSLRAWIIGMRMAGEDRYLNREFTFKAEMDAMNSEYGSYIAVIEDIPKFGQSCLILQVNSDHVVVSEMPEDGVNTFAWRDRSGKYQGNFPIKSISENKVYVDLPIKPIISLKYDLPNAYLGFSDKISNNCLVDEINPSGMDNATIKATIYDERVYAYDNYTEIE